MILHEVRLVVVAGFAIQPRQHIVFVQIELTGLAIIDIVGHQVGQTDFCAIEVTVETSTQV